MALFWAPDEDQAYAKVKLSSKSGDTITVEYEDGGQQKSVKESELLPRDPNIRVSPDMDQMGALNKAAVLHNVQQLFSLNAPIGPGTGFVPIYSAVGPVLIAMNPFQKLNIYGQDWVNAYHQAKGDVGRNKQLGPHPFQTVQESHTNLKKTKNQAIVICGESGAGKTVTARKMIDYLCEVTKPKDKGSESVSVQAISDANVLLEAFGNAKTTRNENSSRFGKYTKLLFEPDKFELVGCEVDHYLLERSRVVAPSELERNYHFFYQLLKSPQASGLGLSGDREDYRYTRKTGEVREVNDATEFDETIKQFKNAGFQEATIKNIQEITAAVLLLGNVEFEGDADNSKVASKHEATLQKACGLLKVDSAELAKALVTEPTKSFVKNLGVEKAKAQQDTLAKQLYSKMFDKIVGVIGEKLAVGKPAGHPHQAQFGEIGLLDIFGFEDMPINGFEQLFINLTNERIQYLFNQIMFEKEKEVYKLEGIPDVVDLGPDNLECVKLFTSKKDPRGMITELTEATKMDRDDASEVQTMNKLYKGHAYYDECRLQDAKAVAKSKGLTGKLREEALHFEKEFLIKHYAGRVMYTVEGWVPKNNDNMREHLAEVFQKSSCDLVKSFFPPPAAEDAVGKVATVGQKFVNQLEALASALEKGQTLFVRCIKSNPQQQPGIVNRPLVMEQLINGGVISALEMRMKGLPDRMTYEEFTKEFVLYLPKGASEAKAQTQQVLKSFFPTTTESHKFAQGNTKLFCSSKVLPDMRQANRFRENFAVMKVQDRFRTLMHRAKASRVERAWADLQEVEEYARSNEVADNLGVVAALDKARSVIGPMNEKLKALKSQHGDDLKAISDGLDESEVKKMPGKAQDARVDVENLVKQLNHGKVIFSGHVADCMQKVDGLRSKVAEFQTECTLLEEGSPDDELKKALSEAKAACGSVFAHISEVESALVTMKKAGPKDGGVGADGKMTVDERNPAPEADKLVREVEEAMKKIHEQEAKIEDLKVNFEEDAKEALEQHDAASATLTDLSGKSGRFAAEGLTEVEDTVAVAVRTQLKADEIREAGRDVDGYKQAVAEFCQAVGVVEEAFERNNAELERREKERKEKRELEEKLEEVGAPALELIDNVQRRGKKLWSTEKETAAQAAMAEVISKLDDLRARFAETSLDDLKASVEALIKDIKPKIDEHKQAIEGAQKEREDEFARRQALFGGGKKK